MTSSRSPLALDIAAYEAVAMELLASSAGKWVVFHDGTLKNTSDDFDAAAIFATTNYGRGPYLIRQVGQDDIILPVSVTHRDCVPA